MRQQFTWNGSGEVLEHYPPHGRPTSAAVIGYSTGTSELWGSEPVTLDPYTDTITGADKGDTLITVTDSSDAVIGRRFWVATDTGGLGHEVQIVDKPSSTTVLLAAPLRIDISSGTIEGHRLARTMTEVTARYRSSRALWTLTYPTGEVKKTQWLDIVALPLTLNDVDITEADLEGAETDFGESVDSSGMWRWFIERSFSDIWQALAQNHKPDLLRSRDMLRDPMIYRTLYHRYRQQDDRKEDFREKYDEAMAKVLKSTEAWYDSDDDLLQSLFGITSRAVGADEMNVRGGCSVYSDGYDGDGIANEGWPARGGMQVT